jgi:hypothetical protein
VPRLRKGDRAACLYRDCDEAVTGWTDARISRLCGLLLGTKGHPSLLEDEELPRAVRHESAAALRHWWGVSSLLVWKWRKALGADRLNCEGSQRLFRDASEQGAARTRGAKLPPEQVEQRRRTAVELGYVRRFRPGYNLGPWWSPAEVRLLGRLPDEEVAARTGRSPNAVRIKCEKLGIYCRRTANSYNPCVVLRHSRSSSRILPWGLLWLWSWKPRSAPTSSPAVTTPWTGGCESGPASRGGGTVRRRHCVDSFRRECESGPAGRPPGRRAAPPHSQRGGRAPPARDSRFFGPPPR